MTTDFSCKYFVRLVDKSVYSFTPRNSFQASLKILNIQEAYRRGEPIKKVKRLKDKLSQINTCRPQKPNDQNHNF